MCEENIACGISHNCHFLTRLSVTISNAIQPGGQTTTMPACTIWTARVWPTGAKMHTPITSPCPTHPSTKTKLHSWPQIASSLRWVNIYWKKQGGCQWKLSNNLITWKRHGTWQRINGQFSGNLFHVDQSMQPKQIIEWIILDEALYIEYACICVNMDPMCEWWNVSLKFVVSL